MTGIHTQLDIFFNPTLNVCRPLKDALNRGAKICGLSREQIVDRMNELADRYGACLTRGAGRRLTIETFEKWLNPSDMGRQMPIKALPFFCAAVKDWSALEVLALPLGLRVIGQREQRLLQWAEAKRQVTEATRAIRRLEADL